MPTDLTTLADDDLDTLRRDILAEQERRVAVATIPDTINALRNKYIDDGGDPDNLT